MVKSCSAYGCTERAKKGGVSFHSFPKDVELRNKWVIATKRKDFKPTDCSAICGRHFNEDDFQVNFGRKSLKKDAVPSKFNFPDHLTKPPTKKRKCRSKACSSHQNDIPDEVITLKEQTPELSTAEDVATTSSSSGNQNLLMEITVPSSSRVKQKKRWNPREPIFFRDYKQENLKTDEAKRLWVVANKQIKSNERKIKLIRIKEKRLQAKVKTLQDLLSHLKEKNRISDDCFSILDKSTSVYKEEMPKKKCFVPTCTNTSENAPIKLFLLVPGDYDRRVKWYEAVNERYVPRGAHTYCCEDHFDLKNDVENWMEYKTIGTRLRMSSNAVPHKFIFSPKPPEAEQESQLSLSERKRKLSALQPLGESAKKKFFYNDPSSHHTPFSGEVEPAVEEATLLPPTSTSDSEIVQSPLGAFEIQNVDIENVSFNVKPVMVSKCVQANQRDLVKVRSVATNTQKIDVKSRGTSIDAKYTMGNIKK